MKTASLIRVGLFAAGLAVAFGGAFLAGAAIDPDVGDGGGAAHAGDGHPSGAPDADAATPARLVVADQDFERGASGALAFRIVDRDGRTVEDFDVEHDRTMHVIAVRRDLTGYRHVHPHPDGDGGWTVEIDFPTAGPHRIFADFVTRGEPYTLSADIDVAGRYAAQPLPAPATAAEAGDGYAVALARRGRERRFTVSKDGRPVDDVQPYLGARGHLVALAERDLAFEHVHPKDRATEGREIRFDVALRRPGRYRLFLQFQHEGKVHTAAFTEQVDAAADAHREDGHAH
ncbi:MAG: hypothetical protein M3N56_11760 [Actinomycetota bacterium]|nr:hypothetical protein [Actinomycetota bacterium]